jgi:hypothetical protein
LSRIDIDRFNSYQNFLDYIEIVEPEFKAIPWYAGFCNMLESGYTPDDIIIIYKRLNADLEYVLTFTEAKEEIS